MLVQAAAPNLLYGAVVHIIWFGFFCGLIVCFGLVYLFFALIELQKFTRLKLSRMTLL